MSIVNCQKSKVLLVLLLVTGYALLVTVPVAHAQWEGGLVPCGRSHDDPTTKLKEDQPCTLCHLFLLINRIIIFVRNLAFLVAAIFIVAGGLMMLLSGAYQGLRERGKKVVSSAVIGLVVMLLSWVIVSSILVMLAGPGAKTYFNLRNASFVIECQP